MLNGSIGTIMLFHQIEELFGSGNGHAGYGDGCACRIDPSIIGPPFKPSSVYYLLIRFKTNADVEFVYWCQELFQVEDFHEQIIVMCTLVSDPLSLYHPLTRHTTFYCLSPGP